LHKSVQYYSEHISFIRHFVSLWYRSSFQRCWTPCLRFLCSHKITSLIREMMGITFM